MAQDWKGKNILIVGGSSGIGNATAQQLKAAGADVYNASRRPSGISGVGDIELDITTDFSTIDGLPSVLDGLVYCPGSINLKPFQSLKIEDFQADFNINVLGAIRVIKASLKSLKSSSSASIVLFSTVAVSQGMNFHSSVAVSKGAIEGLTKSLAAEFSRSGIRVNAIAPSLTDTPMAAALLSTEEKRKASEDRHPLKGVGNPEDFAEAVSYLLSDATKWMTGQILRIDGGMSTIKNL
jgi:NAD(P)-dependent dehydrogenase (short-subunit alcohol dehydrogenase family)